MNSKLDTLTLDICQGLRSTEQEYAMQAAVYYSLGNSFSPFSRRLFLPITRAIIGSGMELETPLHRMFDDILAHIELYNVEQISFIRTEKSDPEAQLYARIFMEYQTKKRLANDA